MADDDIPTVEYQSAQEAAEQTGTEDALSGIEEVQYQRRKPTKTEQAQAAVGSAAAKVGSIQSGVIGFIQRKKAEYDADAPNRAARAAEMKARQEAAKRNPNSPFYQAQASRTQPAPQGRPNAPMGGISLLAPPSSPQAAPSLLQPASGGSMLSFAPSSPPLNMFAQAPQPQYPRTTKVRVTKAMRREIRTIQRREKMAPRTPTLSLVAQPGQSRQPTFTLGFFAPKVMRPTRKARRRKR